MKKTKILLAIIVFLFASLSLNSEKALALSQKERESIVQQIEIIQREISLLQMLVSNMRLNQAIISPSYLAVDLSNNSSLLESNSTKAYPIASITKLMTAVVAIENINLDQKIRLNEEMLKPMGHSPTLFLGLNVTAENLLKASLVQSTNDASEALAHFLGKEKFISLMNQKAKEIDMNNTFFYDVHGLNPSNQSTPQDLAKLLAYIYENHPEILTITKSSNFWLPDTTGRMLKFQNVNNFYPLSSFIGGKTGYLPEAKQTIASIFNLNGKPIAIVLLSSANRQADVFTIIKKIKN